MEWIVYALAVVGALALLLLAGILIAGLLQPEEPRHVDLDLLIEMPRREAAGERGGGYGRRAQCSRRRRRRPTYSRSSALPDRCGV